MRSWQIFGNWDVTGNIRVQFRSFRKHSHEILTLIFVFLNYENILIQYEITGKWIYPEKWFN